MAAEDIQKFDGVLLAFRTAIVELDKHKSPVTWGLLTPFATLVDSLAEAVKAQQIEIDQLRDELDGKK